MSGLRLRYLMRPVDDRAGDRDFELLSVSAYSGVVPRSSLTGTDPRAEDLSNYKVCRTGDIVVNRMSAYQGALGEARQDGIVSPDYLVFRCGTGIDSGWLAYVMRSAGFVSDMSARVRGIGGVGGSNVRTPRISAEAIGEILIDPPEVEEQRRIADYLDAETARIDALITKRHRQIELLEERLSATVSSSVLGGARLSAEGRLVDIAEGWHSTVLRHLKCDVQTGPFGSQLHSAEYVQVGWPVVNPQNLRGGEIVRIDGMEVTSEKRTELERHVLREDDIVFGRRGEMGRAGLVRGEQVGWLCGTGSLRLRLADSRLRPDYLKLVLESMPLRGYFELSSVGSTMDNLNSEIVLDSPVLLPPVKAQVSIVAAVRSATEATNAATSALSRQMELLRERRQALITAAVTGESGAS